MGQPKGSAVTGQSSYKIGDLLFFQQPMFWPERKIWDASFTLLLPFTTNTVVVMTLFSSVRRKAYGTTYDLL